MDLVSSSSEGQSSAVKRNTDSLLASTPGDLRISTTDNSAQSNSFAKSHQFTNSAKRSLNFDSESEDNNHYSSHNYCCASHGQRDQLALPGVQQEPETPVVDAPPAQPSLPRHEIVHIAVSVPPDPTSAPGSSEICKAIITAAPASTSTPAKSCLRLQGSGSGSKSTSSTNKSSGGVIAGAGGLSVSFAGGTTVEEFSVHSSTPDCQQQDSGGTPAAVSSVAARAPPTISSSNSSTNSPHWTSAAASISQPYQRSLIGPQFGTPGSVSTASTPVEEIECGDVTISGSLSSEYPQLVLNTISLKETRNNLHREHQEKSSSSSPISKSLHQQQSVVYSQLQQQLLSVFGNKTGIRSNDFRATAGGDREQSGTPAANHFDLVNELQSRSRNFLDSLSPGISGQSRFTPEDPSPQFRPQFRPRSGGIVDDSADSSGLSRSSDLRPANPTAIMTSQPGPHIPVVPKRAADIRSIFDKLHSEQTRFNGVGAYVGGEEANMLNQLRLEGLSEEEIRWLATLPADKLREMYEAEVYRRLHCERKITTLQRQLMQLEQRLTVMETINGVQRDSLGELEGILASLLTDLVRQETDLSQRFETLLADSATMKSRLSAASETLTQRTEELQSARCSNAELQQELGRTNQLLQTSQDTNGQLETKCDSLIQTNERLKHEVDSYKKEKSEWFNREKTMYTDVCALEKFLTEQKDENTRLRERVTLAEQKRMAEIAKIDSDCKRQLEDGVAQTRDKLRAEFESRISRLNQDWENLMQKHADRYKELLAKYESTVERLKRAEKSKRSLQQRLIHEFQGILKLKYDEIQDLVEETADRPSLNSTSNDSVQQRLPGGAAGAASSTQRKAGGRDGNPNSEQVEVASSTSSEMEQLDARKRELQRFIDMIQQKHSARDSGLPMSSRSGDDPPPF